MALQRPPVSCSSLHALLVDMNTEICNFIFHQKWHLGDSILKICHSQGTRTILLQMYKYLYMSIWWVTGILPDPSFNYLPLIDGHEFVFLLFCFVEAFKYVDLKVLAVKLWVIQDGPWEPSSGLLQEQQTAQPSLQSPSIICFPLNMIWQPGFLRSWAKPLFHPYARMLPPSKLALVSTIVFRREMLSYRCRSYVTGC